MGTITRDRIIGGSGTLALALLFIAPSALALFASFALAHEAFPASALWFVYEVSFYAGCVGVGITAILAIVEAIRRQIPPLFPGLMALSVVVGIFLLWWATHIYQNPWAPIT
ncbi:MAG: hypothetical protein ABSE45_03820 [Candidatus Acidiferrales bacterium]|jgi:hypothetical protein